MKKYLFLAFIALVVGCTSEGGKYVVFEVESESPKDRILLKLPNTYRDIVTVTEEQLEDSLLMIPASIQNQFPMGYVFYDSTNHHNYITMISTVRVDIGKRRDPGLMTVPAVPLNQVFPDEDENREVVMEVRDRKYGSKVYQKRKYKLKTEWGTRWRTIFHISTLSQSSLVQVMNVEQKTR